MHIWTTDAQVLLENVMSNGALVTGAITPTIADAPVAELVQAAQVGTIKSTFPRVAKNPGEAPHQSSSGLRITGCKFRAIVPGAHLMQEIGNWAQSDAVGDFTFTMNDASLSVEMARMMTGPTHPFLIEIREMAERRVRPGTVPAPVVSLAAKDISGKAKQPFRYIHLHDSEILLGPSILVADTVNVRDTRFSRFGSANCHAGQGLANRTSSDLFGSELGYLVYNKPEIQKPRPWHPVCFVIARRSSLSGNLGFPADAKRTGENWPLIIDYAQRNQHLSYNLELLSMVPLALRDRLITLHQKYLENPIK